MIDFAEKARITKLADDTLKTILSKSYDNFDQYQEVSKITELEVAKMVIKRLLDKVDESNHPTKEAKQVDWFNEITDRLKNQSADSFQCDDNGQILVPTESAADAIADMLELLYLSQGKEISVNTKYYDPEEDAYDDCIDRYTGWWCVTIE